MYFFVKNTDEYKETESDEKRKFFSKKVIIIIIISIVVIGTIILISLLLNKKPNSDVIINIENESAIYLDLKGEEEVILYQGTEYIEPGYTAHNQKGENLDQSVVIETDLNINETGEYIIKYQINNIIKTRKIKVIEKAKEDIYIELTKVNGTTDIYVKKGEKYIEPGYRAFNSDGLELNNKVQITGKVDTNKKGTYVLTYSIYDSQNIQISITRNVIVIDTEISLSLSNNNLTNKDINININVTDEFFDYMILPNGIHTSKKMYTYNVSENGTYDFKVYNKNGVLKQKSIKVTNIDKTAPNGSCKMFYDNNRTTIQITANDSSGIEKYIYNNKSFSNNNIVLSSYVEKANVIVRDKAGNTTNVSCKLENKQSIPVINNISNNGVIVNIESKKANSDIVGYYFSYTNNRPNKNKGGYLATNKTKIDVVRLAGTTYVWVEDKNGNISKPVSITINSNALLLTGELSGYNVLRGTKLEDYLNSKGTNITSFNKLIYRSVLAAGIYTKEGAATAGATLQLVLAQNYKIKLPYWRGGKSQNWGASSSWGTYYPNPTYEGYNYFGMDCDGFINWAYKNAGVVYNDILNDSYYLWNGIAFSKENGEVGDIIKKSGHVSLIIGVTDDAFIIAEAYGEKTGLVINKHPFTKSSGYSIIKGERLFDKYSEISRKDFPAAF